MNKEIWLDINGYEGNYRISNRGRIWGIIRNNEKKPSIASNGYYMVSLSKKSHMKSFTLHSLLAQHFIEKPKHDLPTTKAGTLTVNHKDRNRLNNALDNLEWITLSDNIKDSFFNNKRRMSYPKLWARKKIVAVDTYGHECLFDSITIASNNTKISRTAIANVLANRSRTAGNYKWKYAS